MTIRREDENEVTKCITIKFRPFQNPMCADKFDLYRNLGVSILFTIVKGSNKNRNL